jgi:hypothetical protein
MWWCGLTGIFKEMQKLLVLQTLQLFMVVVYPFLAASAKKYPTWEVLWAIAFPLVAMFTKWVLMKLFMKEWLSSPALAAPILANHDIISACLPACLLPSTVSFATYMCVAAVSAFQQLWDLRDMWLPVLKLLLRITKPEETDGSIIVMRREISRAHSSLKMMGDQQESFEEEESQETGTWADLTRREQRQLAVKAHAARMKQQHVTVREALQDVMLLENAIKDGDFENFKQMHSNLEEAAFEKALLTFGHEHVLAREYQIVVTLVGEFYESFVPILVLCLEFFLKFGWNRDCVPSVSQRTNEEFFSSAFSMVCYIGIQVSSTALTAFIVSTCTELQALPVLSFVLSQHFEMLLIGTASGLVFSYTASIPHYNFNVDVFVDEGLAGGFGAIAAAVGAERPLAVSGCDADLAGSW